MLRRIRIAAVLVTCATLLAQGYALAETVTILHVNDTHSHLDAVGPKDLALNGTVGGLAKAASVIGYIRSTVPNTLLLHAGDLFQGESYFNVTGGVAELSVLNGLGLDAIAMGNHELVAGPEFLLGVLGTAWPPDSTFAPTGPPMLSANLLGVEQVPGLGFFVKARMTKKVGNVTVGIFGLTTVDSIERPDPASLSSDFATIAQQQVEQLHAEGAQLVICLSHLGFAGDKELVAHVHGLDAVVGGHDHLLLDEAFPAIDPDGRVVPIVQAGEFYKFVGELVFDVTAGGVAYLGSGVVPIDAHVPRAPEVTDVVVQVQHLVNAKFLQWSGGALTLDMFHRPVALAIRTLKGSVEGGTHARDTALGNLTADALRHAGKTDIGITVSGFVEGEIARGFVVPEDLFGVVCDGLDPAVLLSDEHLPGLGFPVETFELTGAQFLAALEAALDLGGDFFPQVSGMTLTFDSSRPPGQRVLSVVVAGRPLRPARWYTFTANFGLVEGLKPILARLGFAPQNVTSAGTYEILAMVDWARHNVLLDYRTEGRIRELAANAP